MDVPLSRSLQALADPTRRQILQLLRRRDMTAGEIAAQFAMSAPSVSHHLAALKNAGLVRAERNGQTIVYSLESTVVQEVLQELFRLFHVGEGAEYHA
ncbi:MAG: autorepressor SdpR family transcription factor [Dehalococcoidia bacterium]